MGAVLVCNALGIIVSLSAGACAILVKESMCHPVLMLLLMSRPMSSSVKALQSSAFDSACQRSSCAYSISKHLV